MTGGSSSTYKTYTNMSERLGSSDENVRYAAREERASRLRGAAREAEAEPARERAKEARRFNRNEIDHSLARNSITVPPHDAQEVHLIAVDNSGSNHDISVALCNAGGYIQAQASSLAGDAALAMQFFSDHCDGPGGLFQWVDYVMPGKNGEAMIRASVDAIRPANGGDTPEAIECALHELAKLDFHHVPREKRHLYLVTDVVAHGMGWRGDDGCPYQRDWRESLLEVERSFGSFQIIATGSNSEMFALQKQFINDPQRLRYDLMDMVTSGLSNEERCRLVPNSVLFFIARNRGEQGVRMFLSSLFVKWMENPQYGSKTEERARAQIRGFIEYLELNNKEREELYHEVAPSISE